MIKKKYLLVITIVLLVALIVSACANDPPKPAETTELPQSPSETTTSETTESSPPETDQPAETNEPVETNEPDEDDEDGGWTGHKPVHPMAAFQVETENENIFLRVDKLDYKIEVTEYENMLGHLTAVAEFTNNSDYPIRRFELYPDFQTEYGNSFGEFMTVMPGETSTIMVANGKEGMKPEKLVYVVFDKGENYEITYFIDEDRYEQRSEDIVDMNRVRKREVVLPVDFEFHYRTDPPDIFGTIISHVWYDNNTDLTIETLVVNALSRENQENHIYGHFGNQGDPVVPPGTTSDEMSGYGANDLEFIKVSYEARHEGKLYHITYDYKLDIYHQFEVPE